MWVSRQVQLIRQFPDRHIAKCLKMRMEINYSVILQIDVEVSARAYSDRLDFSWLTRPGSLG